MKKVKKSRPTQEMLGNFKEISKFISSSSKSNTSDKRVENIIRKKEKVKMPYKMYMGIKQSVLKKNEKQKEYNSKNNILAQSHTDKKLMTKVILSKHETLKDRKKNRKLFISREKNKSKFQEGTLNLSKNFMKNINIK